MATREGPPEPGTQLESAPPQYWLAVYRHIPETAPFEFGHQKKTTSALYEHEAWLGAHSHINAFARGDSAIVEIVTTKRDLLPRRGRLAFLACNTEHDVARTIDNRVHYLITVQTETVDEHAYGRTLAELKEHARSENHALLDSWRSPEASHDSMSLLCTQFLARQVHTQSWHLDATCGYVVRSQAIFELITG